MKHTEFAIDMILDQLQSRALQDRTPKKYAAPMFEAWEIIRQYRSEIAALKAENEALKTKLSASTAPADELGQRAAITPAVNGWIRLMNPSVPIKDSLADRSCPNCNAYISWDALNEPIQDAPRHCKNCGQAFDWSQESKYEEV